MRSGKLIIMLRANIIRIVIIMYYIPVLSVWFCVWNLLAFKFFYTYCFYIAYVFYWICIYIVISFPVDVGSCLSWQIVRTTQRIVSIKAVILPRKLSYKKKFTQKWQEHVLVLWVSVNITTKPNKLKKLCFWKNEKHYSHRFCCKENVCRKMK